MSEKGTLLPWGLGHLLLLGVLLLIPAGTLALAALAILIDGAQRWFFQWLAITVFISLLAAFGLDALRTREEHLDD